MAHKHHVRLDQDGVLPAAAFSMSACLLKHFRTFVDANDRPSGSDSILQQGKVLPGSTTNIQHLLAVGGRQRLDAESTASVIYRVFPG